MPARKNTNIEKTEEIAISEPKKQKLVNTMSAVASSYGYGTSFTGNAYPWTSEDVDNYEITDYDDYVKMVKLCRFFYKKDPLAATVINKLVDMLVTEIELYQNQLSDNEFKLFTSLAPKLKDFMEVCALELLVTGLVIPEISYTTVSTDILKEFGIKKVSTLVLPTDMWVRDSATIKINKTPISSKCSYFVKVPDNLAIFIMNKGTYADGTTDKKLYNELQAKYPGFVTAVETGTGYILLENPYVIERRKLANSMYPIPYLEPALEALKHKRNMRKMDYAITSRVIGAVQLITLGNDLYPLTEDDTDQLSALKEQMLWRDGSGKNVERIYQLFGNHTLQVSWVLPPVEALLNDAKYRDINQDILFALGFPRILVNGETERTGTSDPEFALMSPISTMRNIQGKLNQLLNKISIEICAYNGLKKKPTIKLSELQLLDVAKKLEILNTLYTSGNISRETFDKEFGFNLETELEKRKEEQDMFESYGLQEFSPQPHSNAPDKTTKPATEAKKKETKPTDNKENE